MSYDITDAKDDVFELRALLSHIIGLLIEKKILSREDIEGEKEKKK